MYRSVPPNAGSSIASSRYFTKLTLSYIQKTYPDYLEEGKVMLGLDYNTVSPMMLEIAQGGMFTISGKKEKGKDIFVKYLEFFFAFK